MVPIIFTTLCAVVILAESSSIASYSALPSNMREYEYPGITQLSGKPSYSDLGASFVTSGSSPYAKSDSRYSSDSSSDSTDPRGSLTSSFYKSKYGSDTVVNSIRPSSFHTSSSSGLSSSSSSSPSSSSSSSSSDQTSSQPSNHFTGGSSDYASSAAAANTAAYYGTSSGSHASVSSNSPSSEYGTTVTFGERNPTSDHHHRHPIYSTSGAEATSVAHSEYVARPASSVYTGYTGTGTTGFTEYSRPSSYSHGMGAPLTSALTSDYNHHHHHPTAYSPGEDYPPHVMPAQPTHGYKTYVMSSGGPASYPSKYQSVFGAIKSLFTGGSSDTAPSASHHPPTYSTGPSPSYYTPSSMHHVSAGYAAASAPTAVGSPGPGYYFSSSSPYSKSYPPMRLMTGYGGSNIGGNKIIVVRDNSNSHGSGYPPTTGTIIGSPSSYSSKSKLIALAPSASGHTYISGSPSSLQGYASGPPTSGYPGSYSSSGSYTSGHGGSTFLGYSL